MESSNYSSISRKLFKFTFNTFNTPFKIEEDNIDLSTNTKSICETSKDEIQKLSYIYIYIYLYTNGKLAIWKTLLHLLRFLIENP